MSSTKTKRTYLLISGLAVLGTLQMLGYLTGQRTLLGLGFITNASPLPLVFSHFRGMEPFSARYQIRWKAPDDRGATVDVTPEVYNQLQGPYNRRNVYGALFAAGPGFTSQPAETKLWQVGMQRAFCDPGFLRRSFLLPDDLSSLTLVVQGRARGMSERWEGTVDCL